DRRGDRKGRTRLRPLLGRMREDRHRGRKLARTPRSRAERRAPPYRRDPGARVSADARAAPARARLEAQQLAARPVRSWLLTCWGNLPVPPDPLHSSASRTVATRLPPDPDPLTRPL